MTADSSGLVSTEPGKRLVSLDVLRGFAVLGILIMNIQSFSMISEAYINPAAYGDLSGVNKWVWILSHVLASDKFMSIFSILFGAGIILFSTRAKEKGKKAGALHYRRTFWLLVFGLMHAYLIWYGDILVAYALVGFLVYLFRNMKPGRLILLATIFFVIPMLFSIITGSSIKYWPEEQYKASVMNWKPPAEEVQEQVQAYQGGWLDQMPKRTSMTIFMETFLFLWQTFWRVTSMMLLGMALFKWGVLSAAKSNQFYWKMVLTGIVAGYLLSSYGVFTNFKADWSYDYSMFFGSLYNYAGSVAVALGYIGIIMLICRSNGFQRFKSTLSAVGRMAFTNYIFMSLLGMFIFYGNGLGLFGVVERWEQVLFVLGIWLVILIISPIWLRYFYYGPLEWLWRVLTYQRRQPFRRTNITVVNT